jgi:phenylacetate-CoA ligase
VEIPDPDADAAQIVADRHKQLADAHEGLRFVVQRVDNDTLPRLELKAKRVLDDRIVIGSEGERRA